MTKFWHQARKQSESTIEREIRLFFTNFVVQYIQFVLQLFQIYCSFSSVQCIVCRGTISHTAWVVQAIQDGQAEFCIPFPAYLLHKSVLVPASVVFGAIHKHCTYSLSFLFTTKRKEKCSCQEKKEMALQRHTNPYSPPSTMYISILCSKSQR